MQDSSSNLQCVLFSSNSSDYIEVIQGQSAMPGVMYNYSIFWLIDDVPRKRLFSEKLYNYIDKSKYISLISPSNI